jgi:hypothetical protein
VTVTGTGGLAASLIRALAADGVKVSAPEATHGNLDDAFIRLTRDTTSAAPEEGPGMNATPDGVLSRRSRAQLGALLKVQAKLSLCEPYGLGLGAGLPAVLLFVFGLISKNVPGTLLTLAGYTLVFTVAAVRYFRWE